MFQHEYHMEEVDEFVEQHGAEYSGVKVVRAEENVKEWHARNLAM